MQKTNISSLQASHEEADTRMILHAVNSPADMVVVMSRDSNVFLLHLHHYDLMKCNKLFMMAGTSTKRKYVPIHEICQQLSPVEKANILAFHAITGCDVTSHPTLISNVKGWCTFKNHAGLLTSLSNVPLTDNAAESAEEFIVKLYKNFDLNTCEAARHALFDKVSSLVKFSYEDFHQQAMLSDFT